VLVALAAAPAGATPCPPGTTLSHGRWQDECLEADGTRHGPYLVRNEAGRPHRGIVELPAGLRLDFRYGLGEAHEVAWLLSLEVDVLYPFVPLWLMANADWGY
jgi:hypothetical protein